MSHCKSDSNAKKKFKNAFNKEKTKEKERKRNNTNICTYAIIKTR